MNNQTLLNRLVQRAAAPVLLALLAGGRLAAAPLTVPAEVHARPDAASVVLTVLPAGAEPFPAAGTAAPAGWQAVALPGAHEVLVRNGDILKDLTPRPGASYLWRGPVAGAKAGPLVEVATAERGDLAEIIAAPQGGYTKFKLSKPLIGYIPAPAPAPVPTPPPALPTAEPPTLPAPVVVTTPPPLPPSSRQNEATAVAQGESPRLFQGTLTSTRSLLHPRRPYDYQLNDLNGQPYAYLAVAKLPATTQPDADLGRVVVVYGVAKTVPDEALMVIEAETIESR
jgi:hypothetical protein